MRITTSFLLLAIDRLLHVCEAVFWRSQFQTASKAKPIRMTVCSVVGTDRRYILRQGSNELDSSSSTERSSPVILSEAKDLTADRDRPFASLRVTWCNCSNCHLRFVQIEPCLSIVFSRQL